MIQEKQIQTDTREKKDTQSSKYFKVSTLQT